MQAYILSKPYLVDLLGYINEGLWNKKGFIFNLPMGVKWTQTASNTKKNKVALVEGIFYIISGVQLLIKAF